MSEETKTYTGIIGNKFGLSVCEEIGIDPVLVTGLVITIKPDQMILVEVQLIAPDALGKVEVSTLGKLFIEVTSE